MIASLTECPECASRQVQIEMKFDLNTKHFICKKCGLYATREQISDIKYRLNKREKTREDKHDEYRDWWQSSKKDKKG